MFKNNFKIYFVPFYSCENIPITNFTSKTYAYEDQFKANNAEKVPTIFQCIVYIYKANQDEKTSQTDQASLK